MDNCPNQPCLPRRFVIYLPATSKLEIQVCEAVELILCDRLGGATSYPARGIFKSAGGGTKVENVQVLEAYCEAEDWMNQGAFLRALAAFVGTILHQEAIAFAVDGRMETVIPDTREISGEFERLPAHQFPDFLSDLAAAQALSSGNGDP